MLTPLLIVLAAQAQTPPPTLRFSGYNWSVSPEGKAGPGPNDWDPANAWVDENGYLHLKLTQKDGKWTCAEVTTEKRFGFGTYNFDLQGPVDLLDPNVVLGLFNYPTADVGKDGTNEIDIEFAHWGNGRKPNGNFTVWPTKAGEKQTSSTFNFTQLGGDRSFHSFTWTPRVVRFRSATSSGAMANTWTFSPGEGSSAIGRKSMPVHINLWLFQGKPPTDGKPVEIVIRSFRYEPV